MNKLKYFLLYKVNNKMRINALILSFLFLLLVAGVTNLHLLSKSGPEAVSAQDESVYNPEYEAIDTTVYNPDPEPPDATVYNPEPEPVDTSVYNPEPAPVTVVNHYPECSGSGPGMVHDVNVMSDGSYETFNEHFQAGVCGDSAHQQSSQPQQAQHSAPTVVRTYSECAGGTGRVHDVDQMSDGTYRTYNERTQSGACGDDGRDRDQATVVRTYSECAGSPGMVRDVEQLSNGGYRTSNERYQAGSCGDQRQTVPTPTATPTSHINYQCEGTTQVYYRYYSDGRKEQTGQRTNNSYLCGFRGSPVPTAVSNFQGTTINNFVQQTNNAAQQFPTLSASCMASPSQSSVNQAFTWRAMTTGGSGSFEYRWSGEQVEGQTGATLFVAYPTSGNKTVQVTIRDTVTGGSVSTSCSTNIIAASVIPTATPIPQFSPTVSSTFTPTATPTPTITHRQTVQCPSDTVERSRKGSHLVCEKQSHVTMTTASNPVQCPAGTVERSRSGSEIICERQTTTTVSTVSPTPTPATVQCPSGTIERSRSQTEIICERQTATTTNTNSVVINPASGAGEQTKDGVAVMTQDNTSVKELPKTGLPLAAVSLASLMPIGLRIKRMLGVNESEESANIIWTKRQLDK